MPRKIVVKTMDTGISWLPTPGGGCYHGFVASEKKADHWRTPARYRIDWISRYDWILYNENDRPISRGRTADYLKTVAEIHHAQNP
jgi:hypothetical protein